jgi:hypothetical protein
MLHICFSQKNDAHYLKDVSFQYHDVSLSWGKRSKDAGLTSAAVSSFNKFYNDGSFMREVFQRQNNDPGSGFVETESVSSSANQLAAKALQLRVKGKHEEANKLQVR